VDRGEVIEVAERVIVSPAPGVYEPAAVGARQVEAGEIIGHVAVPGAGSVPVRSPFGGRLVEEVAWRGERVLHRQRIAWLRLAA
jgi:predicted deacylase